MKLRRTSTSGQVVLKLIVAKLATIFDGSFTVNFWPSWPEVKWCPSWTPFPSEHGLSNRFPSWEPFLRSTSGQLDQKLIVTMMVTVLRQELLPKLGRSENLDHDGPSFYARNFLHMMGGREMWTKLVHISRAGTSDQVDPKLKIRAMMARIIWPGRRQKREPSWLTFHRGPLLKMCAKLALFL